MSTSHEQAAIRARRPSLLSRQSSLSLPLVLNPFIYQLELTSNDKLRIALMSLTVAPLRLFGVCCLFGFSYFVTFFSKVSTDSHTASKPLTSWQQFIRRCILTCTQGWLYVMGFRVKVRGKPADPSQAMIFVVAPHSAFFDLIVFTLPPHPSPISKAENGNLPCVGRILPFFQPILVHREDPDSRANTIKAIEERARVSPPGRLPQVAIFPEGTCGNRKCLINFKAGAFIPGLPVQPVTIRFINELDTYTWTWQGPSGLVQFWLTLCQWTNHVIVEYLPVYHPNEKEKCDAKLYADNVRRIMAESLEVPLTDHSFEDCRLMALAKKHRLPMATGILEFSKISRKLNIDFETASDRFRHFMTICRSTPGKVNLEEFADYLGLPVCELVVNMFHLYDRDNSGTIDFREYLIGMALISNPVNTEATIKMAFEVFDEEKKGYLVPSDLYKILNSAFSMNRRDSDQLFNQVDAQGSGRITYEAFSEFARTHPEYAHVFTQYKKFYKDVDECDEVFFDANRTPTDF